MASIGPAYFYFLIKEILKKTIDFSIPNAIAIVITVDKKFKFIFISSLRT